MIFTKLQTFPCGCFIARELDNSYSITYCPKHSAAPDMCEALVRLQAFAAFMSTNKNATSAGRAMVFNEANAALRKAEGK